MSERSRSKRRRQNSPAESSPKGNIRPILWLAAVAAIIVLAARLSGVLTSTSQDRSGQQNTTVTQKVEIDTKPLLPEISSQATVDEMAAEANEVLDRVVAEFPKSASAFSVRGHVASLFGNSAEAMEHWRHSLELDPRFVQAHCQIGDMLMEEGDYNEATRFFRSALDLDPTLPGLSNQLADALMHDGQMHEARSVLELSIDKGTASTGTSFLLGQIALQLREFDEARRQLSKAVDEEPENNSIYYRLALAYAGLGHHAKAAEWRNKFQSLRAARVAEGRQEMRQRDDGARVRNYLAITYREVGKVYHLHGDLEEAESHWLAAAALAPEDTESRTALSMIYRQANDGVKLVKVLRQLRAINPDEPGYYLELGRLLVDLGHFEAAERDLTRFCELAPDRPEGYGSLAYLHVHADRNDGQAAPLARKAVQLEPNAENYFLLGLACQAEGNLREALSAVRQAVELEPGNTGYRQAYEALQQSL